MKKTGKIILLFICLFSLGCSLCIPIFGDKSFLQYMMSSNDSNVTGDPVDDIKIEPYLWVEGNNYGGIGHWIVNTSFYRNWLNDTVSWSVEKSVDNLKWIKYEKFDVKKEWDSKTLSEKHTIVVNSDEDAYYRILTNTDKDKQLTYSLDRSTLPVNEFGVEQRSNDYQLSFKVTDTQTYTLLYNWDDYLDSDISSKSSFSKTVKTDSLSSKQFFEWSVASSIKIKKGDSFILDPVYGIVGNAVVDSWEFDAQEGKMYGLNGVVRLNNSEYYATVAMGDTGGDNDGFLRTFRVSNNDGTLYESIIEKYEYDTTDGYYANILQIPGTDKYVVAYCDITGAKTTVATFKISDVNGDITTPAIDTQTLTYNGRYAHLLYLSDDVWVVSHTKSDDDDGWLETLQISTAGVITNSILDTEEFAETYGRYAFIHKLDDDTIALAYVDGSSSGDLYLKTYNVSSAGLITDTPADTWLFANNPCTDADFYVPQHPNINKLGSNIYSITYADSSSDINCKTLTIASTGMITKSWIDTLMVVAGVHINGLSTFVVHDSSVANDGKGILGFTVQGGLSDWGYDGYVYTFNVTSAGGIDASYIDYLEFDTVDNCFFADVIYVNQSWYLIVYTGVDIDGFMCTVAIDTNWASPVLSSPSPSNSSTGIGLAPRCNITIADLNADSMTVRWYTNTTGSWVLRQTNSSCANGTYRFSNTYANAGNTKYWWKVAVSDGYSNISSIYHFTTKANTSARSWKSLFNGYLTGGNNTVIHKALFSGYLTGGNNTIKWNPLCSGYLTGGNNTLHWNNLFNGYLLGGNISTFRQIFSGYLTGGNNTVTWKSLFNGYLTGGNNTITWNNLFNGYLTGGNNTVTWHELLNGYLTGGNNTPRLWYTLFNGYLTGGNNTIVWQDLFTGHLNGGNNTVTWNTLFNGYLNGGNNTSRIWVSLLNGYLQGGNNSIAWNNIFSGYLNGGNNTVVWQELLNGYLQGGNVSPKTWNTLLEGYLTGGNIVGWNQLFNGYLNGGNNTIILHELLNGYLIGGNNSYGIDVTSIYPANQSLDIPVNTTLQLIIHHTNGTQMNIIWYRNNGSIYLGSHNNIGNGTYMMFSNANHTNTIYWWSFNITDGTTWYNSTQWFKTSSYISTGGKSVIVVSRGKNIKMNEYMLMLMVIAFGCTMFFIRRKKQMR